MRTGSGIKIDIDYLKREIFTIPNIISLVRLLLIPYILVLYLHMEYNRAAVWIVISFLSDVADGFIARHFNMVSSVGKVLDPIADKMTQGMVFICLLTRYRWLVWFVCFYAFIEFTMLYMGFLSLMYTRKLDQAKWFGKICTGIMIAGILIMVLFPNLPLIYMQIISCICIAALVFSLFMYGRMFQKTINKYTSRLPGDHTDNMYCIMLSWFITIAAGVLLVTFRDSLASESVRALVSSHRMVIAAGLMVLFALKAMGLPIYIGVIYMVCGYLYGMPKALLACVVGGGITAMIQYLRGKYLYADHIDSVKKRLSAIEAYKIIRTKCSLVYVVLVRYMCLPSELVGIYMGATGLKLPVYLSGSLLGKIPDMLVFVFLGSHLSQPASVGFIAVLVAKLLLSGLICLVLYIVGKSLEKKNDISRV